MTNSELISRSNVLGLTYPKWVIDVPIPEDAGLGLPKYWQLDASHPLHLAGVIHDLEYEVRKEKTSENADLRFLENCLVLSKKSYLLKSKSYFFYTLASLVGFFRW